MAWSTELATPRHGCTHSHSQRRLHDGAPRHRANERETNVPLPSLAHATRRRAVRLAAVARHRAYRERRLCVRRRRRARGRRCQQHMTLRRRVVTATAARRRGRRARNNSRTEQLGESARESAGSDTSGGAPPLALPPLASSQSDWHGHLRSVPVASSSAAARASGRRTRRAGNVRMGKPRRFKRSSRAGRGALRGSHSRAR